MDNPVLEEVVLDIGGRSGEVIVNDMCEVVVRVADYVATFAIRSNPRDQRDQLGEEVENDYVAVHRGYEERLISRHWGIAHDGPGERWYTVGKAKNVCSSKKVE